MLSNDTEYHALELQIKDTEKENEKVLTVKDCLS